jgi:ATPase subunit of ABC transporter with duplicated ATPase domains
VVVSHDRAFLERTVEDALVLDGRGRAGRAPGGYAAWEAARRAGASTSTAMSTSTATSKVARAGGESKRTPTSEVPKPRSPSTLHRLVTAAEREVAALERRRDALHADLAASATDHVELARLGRLLTEVERELATAEERWLALAEEEEQARSR